MSLIAPLRSFAAKNCAEIGKKFAESSKLQKVNKFFEADGFNMGGNAFNTLVCTAVVLPRFIQARDADERREILTRDTFTILTLLFAMKGLKARFSKTAGKANGLVLTNKGAADGKSTLTKIIDYIKPSGIASLTSEQVASKYGQIDNKEGLVKLVNYLKNNGGDAAKALTNKKLANATTEALGDIKGKNADDIINLIKEAPEEKMKGMFEILKKSDNPLTMTGKRVNGWLELGSLTTIVGLLGFGLPALNKKITDKNHAKNKELNRAPLPAPLFNNSLNATNKQQDVFKQFLG